MNYPEAWNDLPRQERRKKIRKLKREQIKKSALLKKISTFGVGILIVFIIIIGYKELTKKTPEEIAFKQQVEAVSLDGKVEEFEIEGRDHISPGTKVNYKTNPPTSGGHLATTKKWGVYNKKIEDKMALHSLEHGGIWISYKNMDDESIKILEEIGKSNSQSVIVSPRENNDNNLVVASWGKMMRLETVDKTLIQKYINTYKNQSPEKLAL